MSNKRLMIIITITIVVVMGIFLVRTPMRWEAKKGITSAKPTLTPTPSATPKTFQFDASTDLMKELESINPQILDSDFE